MAVLLAVSLAHVGLLGFVGSMSWYGGNDASGQAFWTNAVVHWDAHHYLRIAEAGYREPYLLAFFPVFPAAIRFVTFAGLAPLPAALIINFVCHAAGAWVFFRLVRLDGPSSRAWAALALFLVFPASLMFVVPYSESIAFLLLVSSVYAARRGRFIPAAVAGMLAGLARATGWLLSPLLVVEWLERRGQGHGFASLAAALAPLAGLGAYLAMNGWVSGDPFAFLEAQSSMFQRSMDWPTAGFARTWAAWRGGWPEWLTVGVGNLVGVALAWVAAVGSMFRGRKSYGVYCLLGALFVTFQSRWLSVLRYDVMLFPLFILLAGPRGTGWVRFPVATACLAALGFLAFEYAQGRWAM